MRTRWNNGIKSRYPKDFVQRYATSFSTSSSIDYSTPNVQGEKKLHIVAPPGSGKTILGLYVWAELIKKPALVLSPNSAIQAQWLARTSLFDLNGHDDEMSLDGKQPGLLTSLTYQSVTMPRTKSDTLNDRAMMLWAQSLIVKEEATSEEQAMDWIASLASSNKKEYERNMKKYKKAEREVLSQEEGILNWLNPSSKETIEELKSKNIGLVMYHRIPTALCQRKKDAKIFQVNWNEHVSPGIATYVKNDEGKRLIKTAMESGLTCQTVIHENDVYI